MKDYLQKYGEDEQSVPGLITAFMVMFVLFDPLYSIIFMVQSGRAFAAMPAIDTVFKLCELAFLSFIVYTCYCFYKKPKSAVKVAKSFLVTRFVFFASSILINFFYSLQNNNSIGVRPYQFVTVTDMTAKLLLIPFLYVSLFSICWYVVLNRSKTIRDKYNFGPHT